MSDYILTVTEDEIRRLRTQAESLASETAVLLDRIGVSRGWRCLDLGCGVGGIVDLLSAAVGPEGEVVGVDREAKSIAAARRWAADRGLANATFVAADMLNNGLAEASFDLVHVRYVMTTVARHGAIVAEATRLLRPGGILILAEADAVGLRCYPPHPAWDRLVRLLIDVFTLTGDPLAGRKVYGLLLDAGYEDVDFRVAHARARSHDALVSYLPDTIAAIRPAALAARLIDEAELDEAIAAVRAHLSDPRTTSMSVALIQAWGRKP